MFYRIMTRLFICVGAMFATSVYLQFGTDMLLDDTYCLWFGIPAVVIGFVWLFAFGHKDLTDKLESAEDLRMQVLDGLGEISGDQAKQARITLHDMDYTKGFEACRTEIKTIAKIFNISFDKT